MKSKQTIIVVGGGFAGIQFVKKIDETLFDVLLIDKINHHQFQPLFYQVATSQIEPSSISFPLRNVFKHKKNLQIRMAEVLQIDVNGKMVQTSIGHFHYDHLVLAMGCKTNFFGNAQIAQHAFTLKTTYDAIQIRNHIISTFEHILSATKETAEALMNIVIVGAGPTGVELAGAFSEIKKYILPRDYPGIDFSQLRIILLEGSLHTLNNMSATSKVTSRRYLESMGVDVITERFVTQYDGTILTLNTGDRIASKTVIWAAGVIANTIEGLPKDCYTKTNRIRVNRFNAVEGTDHIYALGDLAFMETPLYPKGHPQVANVAINQAANLAANFKRWAMQKKGREYEYKDLGSMATIGRNKAVVDLPRFSFTGYWAWLVWMFLHLMLILTVRNKLIIFINWAWAYFTRDTSLRLILQEEKEQDS